MRRVIAIGELLIDFIPKQKGLSLKDVHEFIKAPGGAPANVAACVSKLGGLSCFIGQVGKDGFGDFLIETLDRFGVDTTQLYQTDIAKTALAFATLTKDGDREFIFYRNPSADMLLQPEQICEMQLKDDILHFCSVSLIDAPIKRSHQKVIQAIRSKEGIISFDPNVRLNLWDDNQKCRDIILEFIPQADIVKISEDELYFITRKDNEEKAIKSLFVGNVKLVLLTRGAKGAIAYTKNDCISHPGYKVDVFETTGAGDAFIGGFLYSLAKSGKRVEDLTFIDLDKYIQFANAVAALTTTKPGAMTALPSLEEVQQFLQKTIEHRL